MGGTETRRDKIITGLVIAVGAAGVIGIGTLILTLIPVPDLLRDMRNDLNAIREGVNDNSTRITVLESHAGKGN